MSGGKAEARAKGEDLVMGTGGSGFGGDADVGPGGGDNRGGVEDGREGNCDEQFIK